MQVTQVLIEAIRCKGTTRPQEEVEQLSTSIAKNGLIHPITVYVDTDSIYMLTGETRLAACKLLKWEFISGVIKEGLSSKDEDIIKEIQIHENLFRYNLPWWDQVAAIKELHELREKQFGKSKAGGPKSGWSMRDTAAELGISLGTISQDITLAKAIELDPNLKKITDAKTARRLIKEHEKRTWQEISASAPKDISVDQLYLGDSVEILKYMPDRVFDAVITDPPWLRFYRDQTLESDEHTVDVFTEVWRTMKMDSFLYVFLGTKDVDEYRSKLPKMGFHLQEMPLIWAKQNVITHGKRSWEYARDYEHILLAVKGSPALTSTKQLSSIFTFAVVPSMKLVHPNEKPHSLIESLINHCTYEGALILDPFAGSGVVPLTAKKMKRKYIAIEREKKYYDVIERRLQDV